MPQAPTSSGCPPSEVTASTSTSASCSRAIGRQFTNRVQHAGGRFRVHHRDDVGRHRSFKAVRSASGSHARPHSTSSRRTVPP